MEANIPKGRLSDRGMSNVTTVIPRIPKTILEAGNTHDEEEIIDMSVAENWLIRDEILKIEKEVVEKKLRSEVRFETLRRSQQERSLSRTVCSK